MNNLKSISTFFACLLMAILFFEFSLSQTGGLNQKNIQLPELSIPERPTGAVAGSEFMKSITHLGFEEREEKILNEFLSGNIPEFMRTLIRISTKFEDRNGEIHSVIFEVMPDYLSIGSNEDFCRVPMGPVTAQKIADIFGASLPTSKLVDKIYEASEIKLKPIPYFPVGNENELVSKFIEHNRAITDQLNAVNVSPGQLISGIKKDVVISNKIADPEKNHHVVIYGWHQLNGNPIQPLYNGHIDTYVDYSHGIRLINSKILLDGEVLNYVDILTSESLNSILSDEVGAMEKPAYLRTSN